MRRRDYSLLRAERRLLWQFLTRSARWQRSLSLRRRCEREDRAWMRSTCKKERGRIGDAANRNGQYGGVYLCT